MIRDAADQSLKNCVFLWCLPLAAVAALEYVAAHPEDAWEATRSDVGTAGQIEAQEDCERSAAKVELLQIEKLHQGTKNHHQTLTSQTLVVEEFSSFVRLGVETPPPPLMQGGLVYIKVPKTGSTTWAGVMRRLAFRHGLNHAFDPNDEERLKSYYESQDSGPSVWANHGKRIELAPHLQKLMPYATYVATIRDPIERAMSLFYWQDVSRGGIEPTVEAKVSYLSKFPCNDQLDYIKSGPFQTPEEALSSYDFVGVTERFDESLLLLSRFLNVSTTDVLYLKSKESGHNATGDKDANLTLTKHPPFNEEPAEVQRAAKHLRACDTGDVRLLKLANEQLDKLVQNYGSSFGSDLQVFTEKLALAEEVCRPRFSESCLWSDSGCAQDCIDDLAKQQGWS